MRYVHVTDCACRMNASAQFDLRVDVPFPISLTPRPLIEGTGNAACQRVLATLMDTLCSSIVRDHALWSQEASLEHLSNTV